MMRLLFILTIAASTLPTASLARDAVRRDVEGYAVASCLVAQPSTYLRDQGDGWAANIIQRKAFQVTAFAKLNEVVKAEVKRGHMATIIVEQPPMTTKQLPIQYCSELVDRPSVQRQVDATILAVQQNGGSRRR